jgi:hypothetical protein
VPSFLTYLPNSSRFSVRNRQSLQPIHLASHLAQVTTNTRGSVILRQTITHSSVTMLNKNQVEQDDAQGLNNAGISNNPIHHRTRGLRHGHISRSTPPIVLRIAWPRCESASRTSKSLSWLRLCCPTRGLFVRLVRSQADQAMDAKLRLLSQLHRMVNAIECWHRATVVAGSTQRRNGLRVADQGGFDRHPQDGFRLEPVRGQERFPP